MSYDNDFFEKNQLSARDSAEQIVPFITSLLHPESVVDVGCGTGSWLAVFAENGVGDIIGLDGPYVDEGLLEIPEQAFRSVDLTGKVELGRKFDIALSLEVAEHLPHESAETFVRSLTSLSYIVLFSAAIPHQGGLHHVNEQWPSYWGKIFNDQGFEGIDCLRMKFWDNPNVAWYYAQNMFLFVSNKLDSTINHIKKNSQPSDGYFSPMVHPKRFLEVIDWYESKIAD